MSVRVVCLAECSCGETSDHVVTRRRTADDTGIAIWCDGAITLTFGHKINGLPVRASKSTAQAALRRRAADLFAGDVCLYALDECATLYRAALAVAKRGGMPGGVRAECARLAEPKIRFNWTTLEADNRGEWVVQCTRLDRFRWPGVAIWRTRSRYEVMHEYRGSRCETYSTTGVTFPNQRALVRHLFSIARTAREVAS